MKYHPDTQIDCQKQYDSGPVFFNLVPARNKSPSMKPLMMIISVFLLFFSCNSSQTPSTDPATDHIRINQLGFYPDAVKEFVVTGTGASSFRILDENGKSRYRGKLVDRGTWEASGEQVLTGDFTGFRTPGTYSVRIGKEMVSPSFEIRDDVHRAALDASIKSFYFQRASMEVEEQYGGVYARAAGHPDLGCPYHPSTGKQRGTLDSPGGWYDAGDYGKYVVNAAISAGQMLHLLELYPDAVADGQLNIPESGNGSGDLLDEIRYELDWLLTMQDSDGGVFHKLTARNFSGFIMPEAYDLERMVIGKGTAATLNFAAVMAQASRIVKEQDPAWAIDMLARAEKAWDWAVEHDEVPYRNPPDVRTGEYGDNLFSDDFYWAAAELYLTTGNNRYFKYLLENEEPYVHQLTNSWKFFIRNMGFHSLLANRKMLESSFRGELTRKHMKLAGEILARMDSIPYHVGIDYFEWGSNSDLLNQAMILCIAHHLSGDRQYLDGAVRDLDYILGKNATGYCFLTGFGAKQVMNPHHRPSGADGIEAPVPGFIVGGPNKDKQDRAEVEYGSDFPAKSFEDVEASYASNEVCLNWNAPAVFVMGYLEQAY
ncbi:MAG TPA: cellulase [Bacteroides sp.]|nr:cellulase [Bacteroides sp.]